MQASRVSELHARYALLMRAEDALNHLENGTRAESERARIILGQAVYDAYEGIPSQDRADLEHLGARQPRHRPGPVDASLAEQLRAAGEEASRIIDRHAEHATRGEA